MMVIGHLIVICLSQLLNVRRFTMFICKRKIEKVSNSDIKILTVTSMLLTDIGDDMC